ncbi:hypothetical protein UlMin_027416 [Ulmus minor]
MEWVGPIIPLFGSNKILECITFWNSNSTIHCNLHYQTVPKELMESSRTRGPGHNKRFWTAEEDEKLIEALLEMHNEGRYNAEGNFKHGHLNAVEKYLEAKLPGCDLKAKPHIESRMKTLKAQFYVVHEMLIGPSCSGSGWDSDRKMVTAEKPIWDAYLQVSFFFLNKNIYT